MSRQKARSGNDRYALHQALLKPAICTSTRQLQDVWLHGLSEGSARDRLARTSLSCIPLNYSLGFRNSTPEFAADTSESLQDAQPTTPIPPTDLIPQLQHCLLAHVQLPAPGSALGKPHPPTISTVSLRRPTPLSKTATSPLAAHSEPAKVNGGFHRVGRMWGSLYLDPHTREHRYLKLLVVIIILVRVPR